MLLPRSVVRALTRVVAVALILVLIATSWYVWRCDPFAWQAPSDRYLVAIFQKHRADFNRLREMATDDSGVIRDISAPTLARSRLPADRRKEYIRLFSSVYPKLNVIIATPSITFVFADGLIGLPGPLAPEWFKGIAYLPPGYEEGADIVGSLDRLPRNAAYGDYLVRVEPNWYLIFSKMD